MTRIIAFIFSLLFTLPSLAADIPAPPNVKAKSFILMDFQSGNVLAESNSDERVEPASLTKLMTAYVVFKELHNGDLALDDEVLVSEKAWRTGGSRMFIEVGNQVKVEDLVRGMIIQSGNDASVALAEHIAGTEETFADLMNREAAALGMDNSHFVNSMGLPHEEHYSSARDIALLSAALIRNYPEFYKWYSQLEYTYNDIRQYNRNRLLRQDDRVDGLKTGYTKAAGYCLASSAKDGDTRLISVVMGTSSAKARARESKSLLNYGFRFFETRKLYAAGQELKSSKIWKGAKKELSIGVKEDVFITLPRKAFKSIKAEMVLPKLIEAPIRAGESIGSVEIKQGDEILRKADLVALSGVEEGGIVKQLMDSVLLLLE
ncbi:MAG: D-alanyl-D-alanine carboxypeptidase family protein [Gammaproteobacteria bacterium]